MEPKVRLDKIDEIDREADRKKARVATEIDMLEEDEERYRELFADILPVDRDVDLALYEAFVQSLDYVEKDALRQYGAYVTHLTLGQIEQSDNVLVRLGWMRYSEPMRSPEEADEPIDPDTRYAYTLNSTQLGIEMVDRRRVASGLQTVAEVKAARAAATQEI